MAKKSGLQVFMRTNYAFKLGDDQDPTLCERILADFKAAYPSKTARLDSVKNAVRIILKSQTRASLSKRPRVMMLIDGRSMTKEDAWGLYEELSATFDQMTKP